VSESGPKTEECKTMSTGTLSDKNEKNGIIVTNYYSEEDVKQFIKDLKKKATVQQMLDFHHNPITEKELRQADKTFAYCGGCGRFVIEEGCTCGMICIEEIDKLAGEKLI